MENGRKCHLVCFWVEDYSECLSHYHDTLLNHVKPSLIINLQSEIGSQKLKLHWRERLISFKLQNIFLSVFFAQQQCYSEDLI